MRWFRRKKPDAPPRPVPALPETPQQELGRELYRYLVDERYRPPLGVRRDARWVMNGQWHDEIVALAVSHGAPTDAPFLLGLPIEVRDDGGMPHLEPAP